MKIMKKQLRLKKKYAIIGIVLCSILVFFLVLAGASYGFFSTRVTTKEYVVYTGSLRVDFDNNGNGINLQGTKPMTNQEGLATTGYTFNVKNKGTINARYQVRLELADDNEIPVEYIKMAYTKTKDDDETISSPTTSEPVLLSNLNSSLTFISNEKVEANKTDTINLKVWLDISTPNDMQGKTFKAKIVVDAIQDVDDGYVMETKPIITLNKFEDGNIDQIIKVGETFTDPGVLEVKDDKDKLTPSDVTVTGTVNTNQVGTYDLTYQVTDSDNNTTTIIRTVAVGDEESLNIKHSVAEVLAMYTSEQQASNEAIICSHIYGNDDMYLDCQLKDTLDNAIAARNRSAIILTKNVTRIDNHGLYVNENKDVILDLNNKTIIGSGHGIYNLGKLKVYNGRVISSDTESASAICSNGDRLVTNNIYAEGPFGIACFASNNSTGEITNSEIVSTKHAALQLNDGDFSNQKVKIISGTFTSNGSTAIANGKSGTIEIENGTFTSTNNAIIYNYQGGVININGGVFNTAGEGNSTIVNDGTINVTDSINKVYIGNLNTTGSLWNQAAIMNQGNVNVNGNVADICTSTIGSNNSGICIYGAKRAIVNNPQTNANLTMQGAYVKSDLCHSIMHYSSGITNIKNSKIESNDSAIVLQLLENDPTDQTNSKINICNSTIQSVNNDLFIVGNTPGSINYTNDVTFIGRVNNEPVEQIASTTGTITQVTTCPF